MVTLEPCNHTGRTGPCAVALIEAGVARVVYAIADPNAAAAGGAERLRAAGVEVQCLGGDNGWLEQPERASQWLDRALNAWRFDAVHLDVEPTEGTRDELVETAVSAGARVIGDFRKDDGSGWVTLTDPEGNEFCIERGAAERGPERPRTFRLGT